MKIRAVVILIGLAISFALVAFAQEKEEINPFPFRANSLGVSYATSTKLSRVGSTQCSFRLTCRPDRSTVVTLFPSDRRAQHVLPDECRGRVPGRRLE